MTVDEAIALLELVVPFTEDELKRAYREALLVWHPDRFGRNLEMREKATRRTARINQAYEVLREAQARGNPFENAAPDPRHGAADVPPDSAKAEVNQGGAWSRQRSWMLRMCGVTAAIGAVMLVHLLATRSAKIDNITIEQPTDASVYLTHSELIRRGWTDDMVKEFLGSPDSRGPNPITPAGASTKLYSLERIEAIEAEEQFVRRQIVAARRSPRIAELLRSKNERRVESERLPTIDSSGPKASELPNLSPQTSQGDDKGALVHQSPVIVDDSADEQNPVLRSIDAAAKQARDKLAKVADEQWHTQAPPVHKSVFDSLNWITTPTARTQPSPEFPVTRESPTKPAAASRPTLPVRDTIADHLPTDFRPLNGTIFVNRFAGGRGSLSIVNGLKPDAHIKLVRGNRLVAAFYVRGMASFELTGITDGAIEVFFTTGFGWDKIRNRFLRYNQPYHFDQPMAFKTRTERERKQLVTRWTTYSLTLHQVPNGNSTKSEVSEAEFDRYQ